MCRFLIFYLKTKKCIPLPNVLVVHNSNVTVNVTIATFVFADYTQSLLKYCVATMTTVWLTHDINFPCSQCNCKNGKFTTAGIILWCVLCNINMHGCSIRTSCMKCRPAF